MLSKLMKLSPEQLSLAFEVLVKDEQPPSNLSHLKEEDWEMISLVLDGLILDWSPTRLLLTGVVVAAGASALVSLLLALGDEAKLRGMLFWLMGDASSATYPWPALAVLAVIAGLAVQGMTDTIFFRPEVQLSGWFCVATLAAARRD